MAQVVESCWATANPSTTKIQSKTKQKNLFQGKRHTGQSPGHFQTRAYSCPLPLSWQWCVMSCMEFCPPEGLLRPWFHSEIHGCLKEKHWCSDLSWTCCLVCLFHKTALKEWLRNYSFQAWVLSVNSFSQQVKWACHLEENNWQYLLPVRALSVY
jgi:hypothetical protein